MIQEERLAFINQQIAEELSSIDAAKGKVMAASDQLILKGSSDPEARAQLRGASLVLGDSEQALRALEMARSRLEEETTSQAFLDRQIRRAATALESLEKHARIVPLAQKCDEALAALVAALGEFNNARLQAHHAVIEYSKLTDYSPNDQIQKSIALSSAPMGQNYALGHGLYQAAKASGLSIDVLVSFNLGSIGSDQGLIATAISANNLRVANLISQYEKDHNR
jgi:hypothetical protein